MLLTTEERFGLMNWFSPRGSSAFMTKTSGFVLGFLALSVAGCSDTDGAVAATAGANSTAGASNAGGGALGAGRSNSAGSSGAGAPSADKTGSVLVYSPVFSAVTRYLYAKFIVTDTAPPCESVTYGDCLVRRGCGDDAEYTTLASAGTITLSSSSPQTNVSTEPDASGAYNQSRLSVSFRGGEALHIMATGAAVPAFSADLMFPKLLLIDEPAADSTGLIKAKTTEDLTLSFSRAVDGVTLIITGSSNSTYLNCTSQASSKTLTVKAAALAALGSGAQLQLYTAGAVSVPVSGWSVLVGASAETATPDLKAPITVQIQ